MYAKSVIVFVVVIAAYSALVFGGPVWWVALPIAVLLGLAVAAVGFNVQHDGSHKAYSEHAWVNRLAAHTLDLLGGSSYMWARKHNAIHHSFTNITGHDDDINVGFLGRLSPHQPRLWYHRFQHLYLWVLYGFLAVKWHWYDDFRDALRGRIGVHQIPRPQGQALLMLLTGKLVFFTLALGVPMLFHPWWLVLAFYGLVSFVQGVVLSVVFQLAHCVEEAEFPLPATADGQMVSSWAAHQVETTVDFARQNRLLSWYVGGLNFQIEHHLFPQICHVHYPALAPLVEETCREFGVRYRAHATLRAGIASHYRWLRRMGRPATDLAPAPVTPVLTPPIVAPPPSAIA
ncbi:MAG: acyl-CoA desaturase [Phycisphaerales bacterium]|nr:acyl-CoA desaturase [Phycisphaerales bacterium]